MLKSSFLNLSIFYRPVTAWVDSWQLCQNRIKLPVLQSRMLPTSTEIVRCISNNHPRGAQLFGDVMSTFGQGTGKGISYSSPLFFDLPSWHDKDSKILANCILIVLWWSVITIYLYYLHPQPSTPLLHTIKRCENPRIGLIFHEIWVTVDSRYSVFTKTSFVQTFVLSVNPTTSTLAVCDLVPGPMHQSRSNSWDIQ